MEHSKLFAEVCGAKTGFLGPDKVEKVLAKLMEGRWAMWGQVVGCPLRDQRVSSTSVVLETTCSLTYPDSPKRRTCANPYEIHNK